MTVTELKVSRALHVRRRGCRWNQPPNFNKVQAIPVRQVTRSTES
jgi:hypothetical protein